VAWGVIRSAALRWVLLGAAAVVMLVFLAAQRQTTEVSYGDSPTTASLRSSGEPDGVTVPSVEEMTALVAANPVVRLPGAIATWDEDRVRAAIGDADVRILVAPPGLDEEERDRVSEVDDATVRVIGTDVSGGLYGAVPDRLSGWRTQFATGDVTDLIVTIVAALRDEPSPDDVDPVRWREPTAAELAAVADDLRATRVHVAPGATLDRTPPDTAAFEDGLYAAFPRQPVDAAIPNYGPALAALFPDRPIIVMYGDWIEYHGPHQAEFAEIAGASFYAQFGDRLSRSAYPQDNVLHAYLSRVTEIRYAGIFDRALPYVPWDPLRVALPALPWIFAACVAGFLALSARELRPRPPRRRTTPAQLAGLAALAVEMSLLTDRAGDAPLTRGIAQLAAARKALSDGLPESHVRELLEDASRELDDAARSLPYEGLRPDDYLAERLA